MLFILNDFNLNNTLIKPINNLILINNEYTLSSVVVVTQLIVEFHLKTIEMSLLIILTGLK